MKKLTVRCSEQEYEMLIEYCQQTNRTQNDVLRELIRKLKKSRPRKTGL
ncbi:CopG family transcriptional regulator [Nodularia spumigena CS-591/12]|nr:CopG family transcriptional regulator [Nodularia spumigena]MDB9303053.1 CopG family transcriptional regulator [Nodularia spumigena CS-591/12]MDB9319224.1 CopG family transcriptional regulator [Nodularia spumigena CS-590/01A]MDB9323906.1 CopG family transcriptional regulator [Nodularia spumigena CS-591/07A]MDB9328271.1 CopG family transcriptional regulator [Nodularia spumigena CS-590/02]MDB9333091.1 CopG family transcriptional regulator [Nodularia spumigena CS-591/04]